MRIATRLKYGLFRLLGVVSLSGAYPVPPRWALNATGKHRFYDAPDCTEDCCPWNREPEPCRLACCAPAVATVDAGAVLTVNGREKGDSAC